MVTILIQRNCLWVQICSLVFIVHILLIKKNLTIVCFYKNLEMTSYLPPYYNPVGGKTSELTHKKHQHHFLYEDRGSTLTHSGFGYSFTVIIIAQFIFLNFGYIIGAILTSISILSLLFQIIISAVEVYYLDHSLFKHLNRTLRVHYWINHSIIFCMLPFLMWTVVLMFQNKSSIV